MNNPCTIAPLRDQLHVSDPGCAQASTDHVENTMSAVVWDSLTDAERARNDAACERYGYSRDQLMWEVPIHVVNSLYADIPDFLR